MSRTGRALSGASVLLLQGVVSTVTPFVVAPILVHFDGQAALGGFAIVTQILSYVLLLDLGITQALGRELARLAHRADCTDTRDQTVVTGVLLLLVIGVAAAVALYAVALSLPLWLHDSPKTSQGLRAALVAFAWWMPVRFALTIAPTLLYSSQAIAKFGAISLCSDIGRALATLGAIASGFGLLGIAIAWIGAEALTLVASTVVARKSLACINWRSRPRPEVIRRLVRVGMPLGLMSLADRLTFYSQSIIVGALFDAKVAAAFYASRAPGNGGMALVWRLTDATVPALNDLHARGALAEAAFRSAFLRLSSYAVGLSLWLGVALLVLNGPFVNGWLGKALYLGPLMTMSIAALAPIAGLKNILTKFLVVGGSVSWYPWVLLLEGALNVGLSVLLGLRLGPSGVMLATVLAHVVSIPYLIHKVTTLGSVAPLSWIRQTMARAARCSALGIVTVLLAFALARPVSAWGIVTVGVSSLVAGSMGFLFLGLAPVDRASFLELAGRWVSWLPRARR
jgi:O-antigen/teichoic acid export membrane protein